MSSKARTLGFVACATATFGLALATSCTNGASYDGTYEGGFTSGPDGSLEFGVSPSSPSPLLLRGPDALFGVYFKQGTFDAPATVTISASGTVVGEGGISGNGYAVTITGAQPKLPWIVFYTNNGGGGGGGGDAPILRAGAPLGVTGKAGSASFGVTTTDGFFSIPAVGVGTGSTSGNPQLPTCLSSCGLSQAISTTTGCNASQNGGNSGDTLRVFDCVLGCGDPAALAAQCAGVSHSVQCESSACTGSDRCCVTQMAGTTGLSTCAPTCTVGQQSYECDGAEDCPGASCCANATGTACGTCAIDAQVCNSSFGGNGPGCGTAGSCQAAGACTQSFPLATGQLQTCAQLSACPVAHARAVPCGGNLTCTGTDVCCLPKAGGMGRCVASAGACVVATELALECEGKDDCPTSSCCAYASGSQCGSCSTDHLVCNTRGQPDCPGGTVCQTPPSCTGPSPLPLKLCGAPSPCPVNL